MKFLHVADLHFGRLLYGRSLIEDQRHFVHNILLPAVDLHGPDAVLIAGDVYDRQIASVEAIALFDQLIDALSIRQVPAVIISGNHDGAERMAIGTKLLARSGIHIVTALENAFDPIELGDAQIFALPYFDNAEVRAYFEDDTLRGSGACMRAVVEKMQEKFDPAKKHILISHCFAAGSETSDSEVQMFVGGTGDVPTDCFSAFDYTALGHLHAAQRAGDFARYAGSPLKYSVDESHHKKSMTLVDVDDGFSFELLPVTPLRDVRRISGTFEDVLRDGMDSPTEDYVEIELTDDVPVFRPADRLRPYYPNILSVRNLWFAQQNSLEPVQTMHDQDNNTVFMSFIRDICGMEVRPEDLDLFSEIMKEMEGET